MRTDATDLGKELLQLLEKFDLLLDLQDEKSFFHHQVRCPEFEVISEIGKAALSKSGAVVDKIGLVPPLPFRPDEYKYLTDSAVDSAVEAFNKLAMTMRKALLTSEMRLAVKSFRRNATERYKQMMRVAEQGWQTHYKNLLIRLDWGFKKKYPATRMRFKSQSEFETQLIKVVGYRKEMLKVLQRTFGKNLTFFAWKIECGDIKGFHIHWLIALNGSEHQDRIKVPRQIATLWDKQIGNGSTYTFNVNALPHAYLSGLRVIDYRNPELWEIIGRYGDYFTKVDYTLKLRMPKGLHSFGCSKLRQQSPTKPGPIRKFKMVRKNVFDVRGPQGRTRINQRKSKDTK